MTDAGTLWDDLVARAGAERERKRQARFIVSRDGIEPELTPFGHLRWYLHPRLADRATHAHYMFELEIPPGSRSGRLHHQGGVLHLVVEGSGYTELDGKLYEWQATDLVGVPAKHRGVTFQHVNTGTGRVRMMVAYPNFDSSLGPEMGVALHVLEPCPEFAALEFR
jgi:quercetin dioxygenase-like cupin family protein